MLKDLTGQRTRPPHGQEWTLGLTTPADESRWTSRTRGNDPEQYAMWQSTCATFPRLRESPAIKTDSDRAAAPRLRVHNAQHSGFRY